MDQKRKPAGLILAAGFSSRMRDFKPLLKIDRHNPLEILINHFKKAGVDDIFVVTGFKAEVLDDFLKDKDVHVVFNQQFEEGMFSSIQAGVRAARENGNDCFLMTPVDVPLIPPYIIKALLNRYEKTPDHFIVACYEGKKGHPLLIPAVFAEEILQSSGENGMKSVTSAHQKEMIYLETNCESIMLDMDTQEAYAELVEYYDRNKYPTEAQCRKILNRMGTPEHVVRHCEAVTRTAVCIGKALNENGENFSIPLIQAAGLLHDALRVRKKHWQAGAEMAFDYGYPEVADIIYDHMNYMHPIPVLDINEKDIVCLADKLRQEDRLVTLEERLAPVKKRWADNPEAIQVIEDKIRAAQAVMEYIENIIGVRIYDLLAKDDEEHFRKKGEISAGGRRIILVRHGETQRHDEPVFMGQFDVSLDAEGREQCTLVGLELEHFDIDTDKIYTSDLKRAVESSEIIASLLHSRPEIVTLPELREMSLGAWDGRFIREIKEKYPEEYAARGADLLNYQIDDTAENFVQLQERVMKKVNELISSTQGDILIVAHSGVNRVIMCSLMEKPLDDLFRIEFGRGTYQILEI